MTNEHLIDRTKNFNLFSSCIPVSGIQRSIIIDIQRSSFHLIPNALYAILKEDAGTSINTILDKYGTDSAETILEYFTFLIKNEYIFFTDNNSKNTFPELDLNYITPVPVDNFILDVSSESNHNFDNIFKQLADIRCPNIQVRFFLQLSLNSLIDILTLSTNRGFESIHLIIGYDESFEASKLEHIFHKYAISRMDVYSTPTSIMSSKVKFAPNTNIYFYNTIISDETHCGIIDPTFFSINIRSFTEAYQHNSCLNGKLSIDKYGNIKNCPSINTILGNLNSDTLASIIHKTNYTEFWHINKSQIDVCKGCEFRYICSDCRAYIENPVNKYSKPLKCGYNPETCEWQQWETLQEKQYAIHEYQLFKAPK